MKHLDYLKLFIGLANEGGGGGTPAVLIEKTIVANGNYSASSDSADGYSAVAVAVPINQFAAALCAHTLSGEVGDTFDPQGDKVTEIKNPCFLNKQQVTKIDFPQCTSIEAYALQYVPALEEVILNACTSIGGYNFYDQENALKKLIVPALTEIQANSFRYMPVLESVDFTALQTITANTLKNTSAAPNSALTRLDLPAIVTINANALQYFTALKRVNIGANISEIKSGVLSYCTNLDTIIFDASIAAVPTLASSAFLTGTKLKDNYGRIIVPTALVSEWKQATNWSALATKIYGHNQVYTWDAYDEYSIGELVKYNGHYYMSLQENNNRKKPDTNPTWWGDRGEI